MFMKLNIFSVRSVLGLALLGLSACAPQESNEEVGETVAQELGSANEVRFAADWSVTTKAPIVAGQKLRVVYDDGRMPSCRGEMYGNPAWTVTGFYRVDGSAPVSFIAAGHRGDGSAGPTEITVPKVFGQNVEFWFQNTNRWGCQAWDSNMGGNYRFALRMPEGAPSWAGDARVTTARGTCNGAACEADRRPVSGPNAFTFDTWTRQRAAITQFSFEVYKAGTTDWNNPDLWQQLDVRLYSRVGSQGPFAIRHIPIERRAGNNTRYAANLRDMDPFHMLNTPTTKAQCPTFPMQHTTGATGYVQANVEFYVTINGVELRPSAGQNYVGSFVEYDRFAICTTP